jgi:DNA-binding winged helix-turn-helix (wHTH) protein/Tol biopolymer transport system component
MDSSANPSSNFKFGPYHVDVAAGQLRKHGTKIRLAGQPFDILVMLLEHAGHVVTREEIQQRLWSNETFVDFENSLNKAINKLRQALADSPEQPTYIETLPRRGYRFIALVEPLPASALPTFPVNVPTAATSGGTPREVPSSIPVWSTGRYIAVVLIMVLATWFAARPQPAPRVLKAVALTTSSRVDAFGAIQTDGVRLFFLQRRGHRWELSQMPASGGEVQPFATPFQNAKILAVSPDASELLITPFESRTESLPLWIMPSVGGQPRRLGDIIITDAVFTPDGKNVTYTDEKGIFQVGRDGLNARKLVEADGMKSGLSWSPDGKALRFQWVDPQRSTSKIWEFRQDTNLLREVLPGWDEGPAQCCGRWNHNGRYYIFMGFKENAPPSVWALREQAGFWHRRETPIRLSAGPLVMNAPLPSLDGRHLYVLGGNSRGESVRFDAKSREFRALLGGQPVVWISFSADGSFAAFRGENGGLWRSKLDGSERRELVGATLGPSHTAVRPGGKEVAYRGTRPGSNISRIYTVPVEGGEPTEIVSENFSVDVPTWSPDGNKLLYVLDSEEPAVAGLYVLDYRTKQKQKVPGSENFWKSRWSPDGKFLASVSNDQKGISIFNWSKQTWTQIAHGTIFGPVAWSSDSQFLYYQDILEEDEPVRRMRIKDRAVERIVECRPLLEGGVQRCGFEGLMPDGSPILQLTRGDQDVYALDVDLP